MLSFLRVKFRHWLVTMAVMGSISASGAEAKYNLRAAPPSREVLFAESVIEVAGQLKVNPDGKRVIELPLTGKGEFKYHEKLTSTGAANPNLQAIRHYSAAKADFRIGERDVTSRLGDDHRLVRVEATESKLTLFSPAGPLTFDELELIDIQGNSVVLSRLLPEKETEVGEKWNHSDKLAAMLLGLDVVTETTLQSSLARVETNAAYMEMSGAVHGSVGGVSSDIEVAGKYQFDLKLRRITWLAMSIREKRAVGHAEPGLDVTARLRIAISPGESVPELADEVIAPLPAESNPGVTALAYGSEVGGFRLIHDRNWHVLVDRHDVTILRFVENGELVAQCNITRLADAAPDKQLGMESFQADIRRVLDKNFGQFADSSQSQNEKGVRVLRAIVAGVAADLPIQWNYYHLTDSRGRQVTLVFTMESSLVGKFGAADQLLIDSVELSDRAIPATPAKANSTAKAGNSAANNEKQR